MAAGQPEKGQELPGEDERLRNLSFKERIYEHIHVSVRTMDLIIAGLCILLVLIVIIGRQ